MYPVCLKRQPGCLNREPFCINRLLLSCLGMFKAPLIEGRSFAQERHPDANLENLVFSQIAGGKQIVVN